MTFIKKSFSLDGYQPFHSVINNQQIAQIEEYNNILSLARHQAQAMLDNANLEANNIITHANEQAGHILETTNNECAEKLEQTNLTVQTMISDAEHQVQDILLNSEQKATQEVWNHAKHLINNLEQAHQQFYEHTHDLVKNILAVIIKKLTSNLEVQDRMQIIVHQVFAKAQEIEYATLFFNPKDFEKLPSLHIPQNWKLEKDIMLEQGLCRLVGAGGEWKTSIHLIEQKMLEAIDYNSDNDHIQNYSNIDNKELINNNEVDNYNDDEVETQSQNDLYQNNNNLQEENTQQDYPQTNQTDVEHNEENEENEEHKEYEEYEQQEYINTSNELEQTPLDNQI